MVDQLKHHVRLSEKARNSPPNTSIHPLTTRFARRSSPPSARSTAANSSTTRSRKKPSTWTCPSGTAGCTSRRRRSMRRRSRRSSSRRGTRCSTSAREPDMASLISHIAGRRAIHVGIELHQELVDHARQKLDGLGHTHVQLHCGSCFALDPEASDAVRADLRRRRRVAALRRGPLPHAPRRRDHRRAVFGPRRLAASPQGAEDLGVALPGEDAIPQFCAIRALL